MRRERVSAARIRGMEHFELPELDYASLNSVSFEAREKLARNRPATLGQASRIPGVSPSDLQGLVLESMKRRSVEVARRAAGSDAE
jgi:tRNA uridine 5-carboxymethylaminomethyl modification enzyme